MPLHTQLRRFSLSLALAALSIAAPASAGTIASAPSNERNEDVEVFCDLRCPFCARLFASLYAGAKVEGKAPAFKFRHYPFVAGSENLARFLEAALQSDPAQRDALLESLYRFRKQTGPENAATTLPALSLLHGLDQKRITSDMSARDVRLTIVMDERAAVNAGVTRTPAVRIRGQMISAAEPEDIARLILDESPSADPASRTPPIESCESCRK